MAVADDPVTAVCTPAFEQVPPAQRPLSDTTPLFDRLDGAGVLPTTSSRVEAMTAAAQQTLQAWIATVQQELLVTPQTYGDLTPDNVLAGGVDNGLLDVVSIDADT